MNLVSAFAIVCKLEPELDYTKSQNHQCMTNIFSRWHHFNLFVPEDFWKLHILNCGAICLGWLTHHLLDYMFCAFFKHKIRVKYKNINLDARNLFLSRVFPDKLKQKWRCFFCQSLYGQIVWTISKFLVINKKCPLIFILSCRGAHIVISK